MQEASVTFRLDIPFVVTPCASEGTRPANSAAQYQRQGTIRKRFNRWAASRRVAHHARCSQPPLRTSSVLNRTIAIAGFIILDLVTCSTIARSHSLDAQEQCAADARKTFQELEEENKVKYNQSTLIQSGTSAYQSHYNSKLDRCLLLISRRSFLPLSANLSDQDRRSILIDANERRYYAIYIETQLANETKPKIEKCELRPGMRQRTPCTTRAEFDAFVARFLEQ